MRASAFPAPRRSFNKLVLAGALAVAATAAAVSARIPAAASRAPLVWRACGNFECSALSVPLDYANPASRQIDLALIRQKAKDPANRIGPLLFNPGGPGGSGIDYLRSWAPGVPRAIQDRFDIISFDPRGVGESTPLLCHEDVQKVAGVEPFPRSGEQWQAVGRVMKAFADLCAQRGRDLLPYLGTEQVARDMDQIRQALGEEKISYVGYSYGTALGSVYADLFPERVRAMVLDGVEDLSLSGEQFLLEQARGFERALERFAADCRSKQCLPASRGDPLVAVEAVLTRAGAAPISATTADRPAGPGETLLAIFQALYSPRMWPELSRAVDRGLDGDGSGLVRLADDYLGRKADGTYDNLLETYTAVLCQDYAFSRDPAHYEEVAQQFSAQAPHFGVFNLEEALPCAYWAAPATPLKTPRGAGAPAILLIGTTGDPATPFKWAQAASKQLESAVLLTFNGEGHTAYLTGNRCVDDAVNSYLVDLRTPTPGAVCGDPALATPFDVAVSPLATAVPMAPAPGARPPEPTQATQGPAASSEKSGQVRWDLVVAAALLLFCVGAALYLSLRGRSV